MRRSACCLAFALLACGKTEQNGVTAQQGIAGGAAAPSGGSGGTETSTDSGGRSSGAAGTHGGSISALGGNDAGGREASGGFGSNAGAGSGGGGAASSAGAAGAPSLERAGDYDACDCGCCGGTTPRTVCYYPDRGDSLETIERDDQRVAMSPSCENAGCSFGRHYVCCATPSKPSLTRSYEITGGMVSADLYRISIQRTGEDERCQFVHIARGEGAGNQEFPIVLPDGWILEVLADYACVDKNSANGSTRRPAIGGVGSLGFVSASGECTLKFDFTLFFASSSGGIDAVRFLSDAQPGPVVPECG